MDNFTLTHVVLSLVGIATGFVVAFGMLRSMPMRALTALFLATTLATSITGFFFPYHGITPGIVVGIVSCVVLAVALFARYPRRLAGPWRWTYVVAAMMAQWLNCFVLIVQLFQKVPALKALAPHQNEPPFKITQLVVLGFFFILTIVAAVRFRPASYRGESVRVLE